MLLLSLPQKLSVIVRLARAKSRKPINTKGLVGPAKSYRKPDIRVIIRTPICPKKL